MTGAPIPGGANAVVMVEDTTEDGDVVTVHQSIEPGVSVRATGDDIKPVDLGLVPDEEDALSDALETAVATCDALITSGGVSMGDFDFVEVVLDKLLHDLRRRPTCCQMIEDQ